MQVEEGLRLQRERLRQLSENNQREVASQVSATLAGLRSDFEVARKEALGKWTEELDTAGVRASHSAAENIGRASEWFQQEAGARLQVLVEQTLVGAKTSFDEKTSEAAQKFASELEAESSTHIGRVREQVNSVAGEVAGHARTQLAEAAETAANSFGQVLRDMSGQETEVFAIASRDILQARAGELEGIAEKIAHDADVAAGASLDQFRAALAGHLETGVKEGAQAFASEIQSVAEGYRAERDTIQKRWTANLDRLSGEAAERYQDRLESACDSWMVSSVRRLNEHGQNVTESLMRSADQALRESCSRLFEGLSEMLRGRDIVPGGVAGFASQAGHEAPDSPRASQ
jgi:hypothetical protein